MTTGPTTGATERGDTWHASPFLAISVRVLVLLIPLIGAFFILRALSDLFYRPAGFFGLGVWFIQAVIVGTIASTVLDRVARRVLPLAALCNMSLVFPDQAPSRFGVALRSGSVRKLESRVEDAKLNGLGATEAEAAVRALEFITVLSRHDRLTRGHTDRVRAYADLIGAELGLTDGERARLAWGVLLHDIGKISVPSEVLNKEAALTDEEWALLRAHPEAGGQLLTPLADWLGEWGLAAAQHHERWDGGGYPHGLAGTEISLAGRITAVADAYDVITSKRSYKEPMSVEAARRELVDCAGTQFDPAVVRAFLNVSLGRRWLVGPLAVLSHLPLGQITTAPALVTAATTVVTAGAVVALAPPAIEVDNLAYRDLPVVTTEARPETTTSLPAIVTTAAPTTAAVVPDSEPAADTTTSEPSPQSIETTTTAAPTTADPTTTATTLAPTTSTPAATTTTTAAPTTTTTAGPTTTTTAPTTTTTAPATTTTTAPPGNTYYLKNPGVGDSLAQWFKTLETDGPDDPTLPNFDTERDGVGGLSLASTAIGFGETDLAKIQRYGIVASDMT
ncbi:MAG: HD-GYP domain-containing protein, partial [Acidimicrobiales bacterium]